MLSPLPASDHAVSPVTGVILLLVITIIAAILVLLLCLGFQMPHGEPQVPIVFKISSVTYIPDADGIHTRGYVTVTNTCPENYRNRFLKVITYVNGREANCNIPTLNNDLFITINHDGVWHLWGLGTHGNRNSPLALWPGNSDIAIEYRKEILKPGDSVTLEVFDTRTGQILSRHTWPEQKKYTTKWFYNYFLNPQAA